MASSTNYVTSNNSNNNNMSLLDRLERDENKIDMKFVDNLLQKLNNNNNFLDLNSSYTDQTFNKIINEINKGKIPAVKTCLSSFLNKNNK